MQYGMLEPKEIDALIKEAWGERVEVYSYSLEIMAPTGFEMMPDMYFFLGKLLRAYGDARAAAERERCQAIAARRASEWRAILSEQPGSVIADNRWHEACDIGALISQPDWDADQPGAETPGGA
jgi:hypothetical protein